MHKLLLLLSLLVAVVAPKNTLAGFPNDLSDVVFFEPNISDWDVTASLRVSVNGATINLPYTKSTTWPISCRLGSFNRLNASVWGIVKVDGTWVAGTFEYLRFGVTTRKTNTFGGSSGGRNYFRPPINRFTPRNGEIYGFMVSGIARDNLGCNNVRERSNFVVYRWGEGEVGFEGQTIAPPNISPIINSLLDEDPEDK